MKEMTSIFAIGMESVAGKRGVGKYFYLAGHGMVRRPLYLNLNKSVGWAVSIPGRKRELFSTRQHGTAAAAFIAAREYLLEEMGVLFYATRLKTKEAYSKEIKTGVPGVTFCSWYDKDKDVVRRCFSVKHPMLEKHYTWYIPIELSREEFQIAYDEGLEAAKEKRKYLEEIYYQPPRIACEKAEFEDSLV